MATITQRVIDNARSRGATVYTRKQWGSTRGAVYAWRRLFKPAKQPADTLAQHITVTFDSGELVGDLFKDALTVERIGYERFGVGWSYNWGVDMTTGEIVCGQPLDAKGAHTINDKNVAGYSRDQNYWARAIAVIGMPNDKLSDKARESIAILIAAMVDEEALTETFDYCPHSFFAWKDCPCDATRSQMGWIYKRAFEILRGPAQAVKPRKAKILTWNAKVGRKPWRVKRAVQRMAMTHRPKFIVLQEARGYIDALSKITSYTLYAPEDGNREAGNCVTMVRNPLGQRAKVVAYKVLRMSKRWTGPKRGLPHPGRQFVQTSSGWLTVVNVHRTRPKWSTDGEAYIEEHRALKESAAERTTKSWAAVGDQNVPANEWVQGSPRRLAKHVDGIIATPGPLAIDYLVGANLEALKVKRLSKHGSDHKAVLFKVRES